MRRETDKKSSGKDDGRPRAMYRMAVWHAALLFRRPISVRTARGGIIELSLGSSAESIQVGLCGGRDVRGR